MKDTKNIPLNVLRIAKEKNLLIMEIEKAVGVSAGYFSRVKRAGNMKKGVSVQILIATAEVLGVPVEELLEEPPVKTNADKFEEVFPGVNRNRITYDWWDEPYESN